MNRPLAIAAFLLGAGVVAWIGPGYIGSSPLALTMIVAIGGLYVAGALELWRHRQATGTLSDALAALAPRAVPVAAAPDATAAGSAPHVDMWLGRLHPSLREAVRLRIEGERTGLPGPSMTPYLVGLLVLLGMLGTFLGMVVTLKGAVLALESTTDLATMRSALAAPVKGLGLAFGTSVAGVAASAMLGLMSALCRRERLQATQALDAALAGPLRPFTRTQQREDTLQVLKLQAGVLPEVMAQMQALMAQMERHQHDLNERLVDGQGQFHQRAQAAYGALAESVDASLKRSLADSARVAADTLQPLVETAMAGLTAQTVRLQQQVADTAQRQLEAWVQAVQAQSAQWAATVERQQSAWLAEAAAADRQRLDAWTQQLDAMTAALQREWQQAGADARGQQALICETLQRTAAGIHSQADRQARQTLAEVARLVEASTEAPRAAAALVTSLREKLSDSLARDNEQLDERARLMATLSNVLAAVDRAAGEQRGAIDRLVASTVTMLQQANAQFATQVEVESARLATTAAQVTGSAVEVASLGEAFGAAVQQFSDTSQALAAQLQRIEAALARSTARSDEQMAYYVAQARELIDLSISSQRQIVDDLQHLAAAPALRAGEAA